MQSKLFLRNGVGSQNSSSLRPKTVLGTVSRKHKFDGYRHIDCEVNTQTIQRPVKIHS